MVQADIEKRYQAMELVRAACANFAEQHNPKSLNYELIEKFLAETAHLDLMESERLTFFGSEFSNLGWDETSKIHRYVVEVLEEGFEYSLWINEGLAWIVDQNQDLEYRKRVAEDVKILIKEASNVAGEEWVAVFWGQFYIKHPLRDDSDPMWLREAEKWLEISNQKLRLSGELGPHELCDLADVYRQQGKLVEAASLYREALAHGHEGCCDNTYTAGIEARLAMCAGGDSP